MHIAFSNDIKYRIIQIEVVPWIQILSYNFYHSYKYGRRYRQLRTECTWLRDTSYNKEHLLEFLIGYDKFCYDMNSAQKTWITIGSLFLFWRRRLGLDVLHLILASELEGHHISICCQCLATCNSNLVSSSPYFFVLVVFPTKQSWKPSWIDEISSWCILFLDKSIFHRMRRILCHLSH